MVTNNILNKVLEGLKDLTWYDMAPFGSRFIGCAEEDSDYDFLVLVDMRPSLHDMRSTNFCPDADDPLYGTYFSSWKDEAKQVNLVFTDDKEYYKATLEARDFCKKYRVFDKSDRCKVHESFRDALIMPRKFNYANKITIGQAKG